MFQVLGLPTKHTSHLGHILGPKKLEMLEANSEKIRVLGNWDPKTQESTYSSKVPMRTLRAMAGFTEAGGMHHNPRVGVEAPETLKDQVFPWLKDSTDRLEELKRVNGRQKTTATAFLRHMDLMASVVVQDVAAMKLLHPDRCQKAPLMDDPLFRSEEFKVSKLCRTAFHVLTTHNLPFLSLPHRNL